MNFISGADIQRATGGNIPPIPENDPERRMMILLWIVDQLEAAGLEDQVNDALLWNCWPMDWMHEADRDLAEFNTRCRNLGWPTGLAGLQHKRKHPGEWPHGETYGA